MEFWAKKFIFHQISKIHQKWTKKVQFFQKKIQTLFCFKITSICRKLIPKLASESSESKLCDYEAWNAPKFNLTLLARLKAQKYTFSAQISRILDFQISKLARLKSVNKNKALTLRYTFFRKGAENTKMLHTQKQNEEFGITSHSTKILRTREDS